MVIPAKPIQKFSELPFVENRDGDCLQEEETCRNAWLLAELQKMQRPLWCFSAQGGKGVPGGGVDSSISPGGFRRYTFDCREGYLLLT